MSGSEQKAAVDPRWYQIGALSLLLLYGLTWLRFDLSWEQTVITLVAAVTAQVAFSKLFSLQTVELKSALISGLSLCLLLRTNAWWVAGLGAAVAIGSKFVLRWNNRHIFNPTNFALVTLMALCPAQAWVSPAQWGNFAFFAFLMLCLGGLVVNRSSRTDVSLAFLGFYICLVFARSLWLGEPMAIPLHKLKNGGLLLFTFFMISDPKTTPDSRVGRMLFAFLVALGGAYVQFKLFRNNGILWSLAVFSVAVPVLNRMFPAPKYEWASAKKEFQLPIQIQRTKTMYETANNQLNSGVGTGGLAIHARFLRLLRGQGGQQTFQ